MDRRNIQNEVRQNHITKRVSYGQSAQRDIANDVI